MSEENVCLTPRMLDVLRPVTPSQDMVLSQEVNRSAEAHFEYKPYTHSFCCMYFILTRESVIPIIYLDNR